jgi:hypothetical protein
MTEIHLNLNNFNDFGNLLALFPASDEYIFSEKQVFKAKNQHICSCGTKMVFNGHNFVRKKGFGKVRVGKQICPKCNKQYHEDKFFFKNILGKWLKNIADLVMHLRGHEVSWEGISETMNFLIPKSGESLRKLFNKNIEQFEYEQENYTIVNYDEQHPKSGRSQKYRLTLLNYKTGNVIADELFEDKSDITIELFLRNNLDTTKKLVVITDCDRRYPEIFRLIWGKNLVHQKCLLHLNKLVANDFGKNKSLQDMYNKYLLLNIFYNRERELKYLERVILHSKENGFDWKEERKNFYLFVRKGENRRRKKGKNLVQRKLWKAKELFDLLLNEIHLFPKNSQKRILMIRDNWKYFTAFYGVKSCPATNNAIENFYSTSLKTDRKKQFRSDLGILNQMKIAAKKRKESFCRPKETLLEIYGLFRLIVC